MTVSLIDGVDGEGGQVCLFDFLSRTLSGRGEILSYKIQEHEDFSGFPQLGGEKSMSYCEAGREVHPYYAKADSHMREVELIALPQATFLPNSHSVMASGSYLYSKSLDLSIPRSDLIHHISMMEPSIRTDPRSGSWFDDSDLKYSDDVVLPICGPGFPNYGHFLYDGLPLAVLLRVNGYLDGRVKLVGRGLADWQKEIMSRLGLIESYVEITEPAKFRYIIANSMLWGHVPYPTRLIRPVFDLIRGTVSRGKCSASKARVFITRGKNARRGISNISELASMIKLHGFVTVDPYDVSLSNMIDIMSSARIVVGEGGAGMANVGFCDPGAYVLELQPSNFIDAWTRNTCRIMGLNWSVYLARDDASVGQYEIDLSTFSSSLDQFLDLATQ